jgi:LPS export ABC transporter protein LptC
MKRVKIAILISMVLIGGIVILWLWVNLHGKKAIEEGKALPKISEDSPDMRLEKIRFVEDKHGRKTWELEAKSIQQYQDQNIVMLEEVKVTIYTEEGQSFVLSGRQGKIHQNTKDMELVGDVVLTSNDGYRLKTHSVAYHHHDRKVTTSDSVEIEGKQIRLVGRGMLVDLEARTFKILSQVKTQWKGEVKG